MSVIRTIGTSKARCATRVMRLNRSSGGVSRMPSSTSAARRSVSSGGSGACTALYPSPSVSTADELQPGEGDRLVDPDALTALAELRVAGAPDPVEEVVSSFLEVTPGRLNALL